MDTQAFALPTLLGGTEALKRLATELRGARRAEFEDFNRRMGFARHNAYIQKTPEGDMVIVYLEGADLPRSYQMLATSGHPFDRWFREQAKLVHGVDFSRPFPGPLPEVAFEGGGGSAE